MDIRQLESDRIKHLKNELKSFRGDKPLYFDVIDPNKPVKLTVPSKKQKVAISQKLLTVLDQNQWHYKLN